jgi:CRP/FNR family nitrogen fixation transcriptional regulator
MVLGAGLQVGVAEGSEAAPRGPLVIEVLAGLQLPAAVLPFDRNEEIFGEEEPAEFIYKVVSGTVRSFRILSDGRRQIDRFHLPGDLFGIEDGAAHRFSAEAIADSRIALVKRTLLEAAVSRDSAAACRLWGLACRDLERARDHMLLLGRKSATERVATFLLEMAASGRDSAIVDLPMGRTDIADYLGLTIETVSRTLTQLERRGVIELPSSRHVELRDRAALADLFG